MLLYYLHPTASLLSTPSFYFSLLIIVPPLCLVLCLRHVSPLLFPLLSICSSSQSPIPPPSLSIPHFTALPFAHTNPHLDLNSLLHSPTGQLCFSVLIGPVFLLLHGAINKLFHGWKVRRAAGLVKQETVVHKHVSRHTNSQIAHK